MPPRKKSQCIFVLKNINVNEIIKKYDLGLKDNGTSCKITKLEEIINIPKNLSYYNESKKIISCSVLMIDIHNYDKIQGYRCWWDHHDLPINANPIGCPIKYEFNRIIKNYTSEISKNKYTIIEPVTPNKEIIPSSAIDIENNGYYLTEGIFCSFNCVQGFLNENKLNPLYKNSQQLLYKLYKDIFNEEIDTIIPAPNHKMLKIYGGKLSIEDYRESFNKIEYINRDIINMYSIHRIYEEKYMLDKNI